MSSEHQGASEDAAESQDRPDGDKELNPGGDASDEEEEDDVPREVAPALPRSSEERPEPPERAERGGGGGGGGGGSGSPVPGAQEPPCPPSTAPQTGSSGADSVFSWLRSRTIRRGVFVDPARDNFRTMTSLYCSMNPAVESVNLSTQTHGAVFNLEYSPDG